VNRLWSHTVIAILVAVGASACSAQPVRLECRRQHAAALAPENGFSASLEASRFPALLDEPREGIEVAMTVVPPVNGTIELVHVLDGREIDRWALQAPSFDRLPPLGDRTNLVCWIPTAGGGLPSCGAWISDVPHPTHGYYYLRAKGNRVLEAGMSFMVCN
jgi:hypothetical protein